MRAGVRFWLVVGGVTWLATALGGRLPAEAAAVAVENDASGKLTGKILEIDPTRAMLTLHTPLREELLPPLASPSTPAVFVLDDKVAISRGDRKVDVEELAVGEVVNVGYVTEENRNVAYTIVVAGGAQ